MRSATELAAAMRCGELGPVEAVEAHIERIERLDPLVNAVVVRCFEHARQEARAAERALVAGEDVGPLHGVPITVKEAVEVEGLPFTNGSRLDAGRLGEVDAPAVRGLRAAGAIVLGKTNIPEFCCFYDADNEVYGRTSNPHDPERTPGGSSGGEAAALAMGMSALGAGSDLNSSIRNPDAGLRLNELQSGADDWMERHPIALCPVTPVAARWPPRASRRSTESPRAPAAR